MPISYRKRTWIMKHFSSDKQLKSDETVNQFITRLRKLAMHCEFTDLDEAKISCHSKLHIKTFEYALREDMTLDKILTKARALERSEN